MRTVPVELSNLDIVSEVAAIAAPLGPEAHVVVNVAGSLNARFTWTDAWRRDEFARPPIPVNISGDGVGSDEMGRMRIGEGELISSLREQVKTHAFTLPAGGEGADVVRAAMSIEPSMTEAGRLRFPSRRRDGRVFALALALYPQLSVGHPGRRYRVQALPATVPGRRCGRGRTTRFRPREARSGRRPMDKEKPCAGYQDINDPLGMQARAARERAEARRHTAMSESEKLYQQAKEKLAGGLADALSALAAHDADRERLPPQFYQEERARLVRAARSATPRPSAR